MATSKIAVTRPLVGEWRSILQQAGEVILVGRPEGYPEEALVDALTDADALVCLLTDQIDEPILARAKALKVIGNCAVGVDNIDLSAAFARGITVCHTPGMLTQATADLTWALLLAVARRIVEADRYTREGRFTVWQPGLMLGTELWGSCLGILGFGRIGRAVAARAQAFGMRVVYWDKEPDRGYETPKAEPVPLDRLLSEADIVTIHLPLTEETQGLLHRDRLLSMKPGALLINTARGPIVDEEALVHCLQQGHLGGAGLDVYQNEPEIHPGLLALDNVVLLPHIGSATRHTRKAMAETVCRDVVRVLKGQKPTHPVPGSPGGG